ncbi:rod shape-determining protein RodA [candidate division KSB1 bacterium]|jgi:rod shape determining protein RodA|nr:MAG: rod shape-determining protein RodA [candidate division KSB1 bacterium]
MQKFLRTFDLGIFLPTLILLVVGLFSVYSATYLTSSSYFSRQLIYAFIGILLIVSMVFLPYKIIYNFSYLFYLLALAMLLLVFFMGVKGFGAERWLAIGPIRLQPSEFAKIATVLAVARYLSQPYRNINEWKHLAVVFLMILIPFMLIAKQPDLGTSLVFLALIIPMLYMAGISWFFLFVIISPLVTMIVAFNLYAFMGWILLITIVLILAHQKALLKFIVFLMHLAVGAITPVLWKTLRPYQQQRILTFLQPEKDPRGAGYQIIQSKVAIGSGGVWGKGFLQGSQSHLNFLPAHHTDFIFSVIGEEQGFVGIVLILAVFLFLFLYLLYLSNQVKSPFARLSLIGLMTILLFHTLINIAMTIGLAPVTGLPLPFLSYGGSFMLTSCLLIGITMNFSKNRYHI